MGTKFWQKLLMVIFAVVFLMKPTAGAYAVDRTLDYQLINAPQQELQDKLTWDCAMAEIFLVTMVELIVTCFLTNTTPGTIGHDVVISATESTGNIEASTTPEKISETPYNVKNEVTVKLFAPPGTPPGEYEVELRAKGPDTNDASKILKTTTTDPTATNTATQTSTNTLTITPSLTATSTATATHTPTYTPSQTPSVTVQPEESVSQPETTGKNRLLSVPPWWAWTFFGLATLFLLSFALWILFFRRDVPIPCWLWFLFGISGLKVLSTLCYVLIMWFE